MESEEDIFKMFRLPPEMLEVTNSTRASIQEQVREWQVYLYYKFGYYPVAGRHLKK